jgi:beta-glucosidase
MMAFYITDQLPLYKDDPIVVSAMREACHQNLYAIAHSCGMNGVGPNTTIKVVEPLIITSLRIAAIVCGAIALGCIVMWVLGSIKLKKTEEYKVYKAAVANYKASKRK